MASPREDERTRVPIWCRTGTGPGSSRARPGFAGPGACPVDHGTGSRSQLLIDATSMVSLVDAFPLVVASGHSPVLLELGKAPLGAVAVLVLGAVEGGRAAAGAAAAAAVGFLVFLDRDDRLDAALAQAGAVGRGGVRLIRERRAGPGARTALASPGDVSPPISGMNCGQSPCWPGVVIRPAGGGAGPPPGGSWWKARRETGPAPPGLPHWRDSCHPGHPEWGWAD